MSAQPQVDRGFEGLHLVESLPEQIEAEPLNVSPLSLEQTALARELLWGLAPELDALIGELREVTFPDDKSNRHKLKPRADGLQFEVPKIASPASIVAWHQLPREIDPGAENALRVKDGFPMAMHVHHPALVPPRFQLIIPNITDATIAEMGNNVPNELLGARIVRITPRRETQSLMTLMKAEEGAAHEMIEPFKIEGNNAPEFGTSAVDLYTAALRRQVGFLAAYGRELNLQSAQPLAERFLK